MENKKGIESLPQTLIFKPLSLQPKVVNLRYFIVYFMNSFRSNNRSLKY